MNTLLVEDDAVTRRMLEHLLKRRGHTVTPCEDAESAWTAYSANKYPLVLLDWMLSGMDGLTLCTKMRELAHGNASLILVVTAQTGADELRRVLDAGADDYISKPIQVATLDVRLAVAEQQAELRQVRLEAQADRERVIAELQEALAKIKALRGLLPICSVCKKIRDDSGYWQQIEGYIREHSDAEFSHSICPTCVVEVYPELYKDDNLTVESDGE